MSEVGIEARVAARWWADKIRDGFVPDAGGRPDDIVESPLAKGLTSMLQSIEREKMTPEKVDLYESLLAKKIQSMLDVGLTRYYTAMELSCDYGPGQAHREALEQAGMPTTSTVLPWKTTMWVSEGRVTVGDGYKSGPVDLPLEEPV